MMREQMKTTVTSTTCSFLQCVQTTVLTKVYVRKGKDGIHARAYFNICKQNLMYLRISDGHEALPRMCGCVFDSLHGH